MSEDDVDRSVEENGDERILEDQGIVMGVHETVDPSSSSTFNLPLKKARFDQSSVVAIWYYFAKGAVDAKCNFCSQMIKKNDTGNCKKHLQKHHYEEYEKFVDRQQQYANLKSSRKSRASTSGDGQQLTSEESTSYSADDYHQNEITVALARAFAANSLAHSLIDSPLFRNALIIMDKKYHPPARHGMKKQIIAQAELLKETVQEAILCAPKLSLCVDLWTKRSLTQSFVGITAHFVDRSRRRLVRVLLSVKEILGKHKAESIAQNVTETLSDTEWNIPDDKVRCIITDNGANIVKAFHEWQETVVIREEAEEEEERFFELADPNIEAELEEPDDFDEAEEAHFAVFGREKRLPCFAHLLVRALKASIEKAQIYGLILGQATSVVTAFTQSTSKSGMLFHMSGKRLVRPVRTRWLFAYFMLERLLELRPHVDIVIENEQVDVGLTPNQWRQAELLCSFLKDFVVQVTELEGEKYVTLNRVIPALMDLLEHCKEFQKKQGFSQIAISVGMELRRRFSYVLDPDDRHFQPIFAVTTLLDPSMRSLLSLKEYSGLLDSAKSEALRLMRLSDIENDSEIAAESQIKLSSSLTIEGSKSEYPRLFSKLARQDEQTITEVSVASDLESQKYLIMKPPKVCDLIEFWFAQENILPKLTTLAFDLFSVTATSAPIERIFSHAGIATFGRRNRLEAKSLNAELLMKLNHFMFD